MEHSVNKTTAIYLDEVKAAKHLCKIRKEMPSSFKNLTNTVVSEEEESCCQNLFAR